MADRTREKRTPLPSKPRSTKLNADGARRRRKRRADGAKTTQHRIGAAPPRSMQRQLRRSVYHGRASKRPMTPRK